jgi:hypothetical protein
MFRAEPGAILQILSAVCTALLAARLHFSGLASRYRIFFVYVVFRFLYLLPLPFLRTNSAAYFFYLVFTEPIVWLLYVGVVIELYRLILERHRGFYTLGRRAMFVVMAVSVAISLAALAPSVAGAAPQSSKIMGLVLAGERAFDLSLALFLVLMLAFLNFYTVPLSRNIVVHAVVFTVFFLSNTLTMVLWTVFRKKYANELNLGLMGLSFACSLAWLLFLTPAGERLRARLPWFSREREERILWQLDSLNAMLVKAGRK